MRSLNTQPAVSTNSEREIFLAALEYTTVRDQADYLDQACGSDQALREAVEALLRNHKQDRFLETPVVSAPPRTDPVAGAPLLDHSGDRVGRYKLLQEIGEGGCGTVYMAEQEEPVRRRVALKIIKPGMDSKSVVARFEAERQALALMEHPHIARVLDAGTTPTGRPYFVMELVRGIKITEYCDQNQLSINERLDLFIQVCRAIQHAHQKGIIHRDIKPSNILVTLHDGVPVPKVIDFGIAKATGQRLTDKTLFTEFRAFVGTPAYTSPEQVEMSGLDIDTRTDIYSLGVLLYELLTGRTPFDADQLAASGLDEMRRIIREEEPIRPSTRWRTMLEAEATVSAARQRSEPAELAGLLHGDLDWIVMKTLEKDRTRRYETVNDLVADIQRYIQSQPVLARPPSRAYRFHKFAQRNKLAFATATAFGLALFAGLALSTWQYVQKSNALHRATTAERQHRLLLQQAEDARRQAEAQERSARLIAYAADMNLVQQALAANNLGRAQEILHRYSAGTADDFQRLVTASFEGRSGGAAQDPRGWEWRYLWQQCRSDALFTLCQLSNRVTSLSVSPDGKWVALSEAGRDGLSLWDLRAREEVTRLPSSGGWPIFAFSPKASLLAFAYRSRMGPPGFADTDGRVRLWDAAAGALVADLPLEGSCRALAFASDGTELITMTSQDDYIVWGVPDLTQLSHDPNGSGYQPEKLRSGKITMFEGPFAASADLKLVAVGDRLGQIRVIDVASGEELWQAQAAEETLLALAFSPDGKTLASSAGFVESAIRLWSVRTGDEIARLEGHRTFVSSLVFWPEDEILASASGDQTINLWDVGGLHRSAIPSGRFRHRPHWRPDVTVRTPLATLRGHKLEVWSLALMRDGTTLISGSKDGSVYLWDTTNLRRDRRRLSLPEPVQSWTFSPNSDSIVAQNDQGQFHRWFGKSFHEKELLTEIPTNLFDVCFSSDGRLMAAAAKSGRVQVWDLEKRELMLDLGPEAGRTTPVVFLNSNHLITRQRREGIIQEWDPVTGQEEHSWRVASGGGFGSQSRCAPTGVWWLSLMGDDDGRLKNLRTGAEIRLPLTMKNPNGVDFSPDGRYFAVTSAVSSPELWETEPLRRVATLNGFLQGTHSSTFSADGRRLAVGSSGNEAVKLWDVESRQELLTLAGEGSSFDVVALSPDGNLLAAQNRRGLLQIWRAPSFEEIVAGDGKQL